MPSKSRRTLTECTSRPSIPSGRRYLTTSLIRVPPPQALKRWVWCQSWYGPLSCVSTKQEGGCHRLISVSQLSGIPCQLNRYRILVPTAILTGLGATMRNSSQGGVMVSRFPASEKNANTSSIGRGTHCSRRNVWNLVRPAPPPGELRARIAKAPGTGNAESSSW